MIFFHTLTRPIRKSATHSQTNGARKSHFPRKFQLHNRSSLRQGTSNFDDTSRVFTVRGDEQIPGIDRNRHSSLTTKRHPLRVSSFHRLALVTYNRRYFPRHGYTPNNLRCWKTRGTRFHSKVETPLVIATTTRSLIRGRELAMTTYSTEQCLVRVPNSECRSSTSANTASKTILIHTLPLHTNRRLAQITTKSKCTKHHLA